eukprot:Rhum_TRINITY_DN23325_c0_g1::Rhum_TRINITY_DN23325_c0_g1_i1::g.177733::m.177733
MVFLLLGYLCSIFVCFCSVFVVFFFSFLPLFQVKREDPKVQCRSGGRERKRASLGEGRGGWGRATQLSASAVAPHGVVEAQHDEENNESHQNRHLRHPLLQLLLQRRLGACACLTRRRPGGGPLPLHHDRGVLDDRRAGRPLRPTRTRRRRQRPPSRPDRRRLHRAHARLRILQLPLKLLHGALPCLRSRACRLERRRQLGLLRSPPLHALAELRLQRLHPFLQVDEAVPLLRLLVKDVQRLLPDALLLLQLPHALPQHAGLRVPLRQLRARLCLGRPHRLQLAARRRELGRRLFLLRLPLRRERRVALVGPGRLLVALVEQAVRIRKLLLHRSPLLLAQQVALEGGGPPLLLRLRALLRRVPQLRFRRLQARRRLPQRELRLRAPPPLALEVHADRGEGLHVVPRAAVLLAAHLPLRLQRRAHGDRVALRLRQRRLELRRALPRRRHLAVLDTEALTPLPLEAEAQHAFALVGTLHKPLALLCEALRRAARLGHLRLQTRHLRAGRLQLAAARRKLCHALLQEGCLGFLLTSGFSMGSTFNGVRASNRLALFFKPPNGFLGGFKLSCQCLDFVTCRTIAGVHVREFRGKLAEVCCISFTLRFTGT